MPPKTTWLHLIWEFDINGFWQAISYLLATGAAAGIGVSIDMMYYNDGHY